MLDDLQLLYHELLPVDSIHKLLLVVILLLGLRFITWVVNFIFIKPFSDPLRFLPGPQGSLFQSHLRQVIDPEYSANTHIEWRKNYGQTFRFHGFGKHDYRLMTFDIKAINHIMRSPVYEKPWQTRSFLGRLIGRGIFSVEGRDHRIQRKIVHPAFHGQSIDNMAPIILQKAEELLECWKCTVNESSGDSGSDANKNGVVIDVAHWISRASFDVMGLSGFNYNFHAIQDESEEVYSAYRRMFNIADKGLGMWQILELYFPILRKIWITDDIRTTNESLRTIGKAGSAIVSQKKSAIQKQNSIQGLDADKDLLTLLIKSNILGDSPKRLSDQELLDQCSTFLLAGSDTVSVALTWCFHFLAVNPEVQSHLRKDLYYAELYGEDDGSDSSTDSGYQECRSCKYRPRPLLGPTSGNGCICPPKSRWNTILNLGSLDAVVRETLRLCPPVHSTIRVAMKDDTIPISHPISLSNGSTLGQEIQSYIPIRKGSYIHIPIEGLNQCEDIWGPDAANFRPARWTETYMDYRPGVDNLMAFGMGAHSCLGHKFAFAEIKIFLAVILPRLEFLPAEGIQISKFNSILTRPYVSGKWSAGTQLPVRVRALK